MQDVQTKINIACVDDEKTVLRSIKRVFHNQTHKYDDFPNEVFQTSVETFSQFEEVKQSTSMDILLLDINLGKFGSTEESKQILQYVKEKFPNVVILMYSATREDDLIIDFLLEGADNFLSKDIPKENLGIPLIQTYKNALKKRDLYEENSCTLDSNKFIGITARQVYRKIKGIIPFRSIRTILVTGETGTGKEIVADIVEQASIGYAGKPIPFERFDCGAIADSLVESELFGSVKGAFTGSTDKIGLFEKANGGWIFLDEVASLTPTAQNAIMRVIENNEVRRVGSNTVKKINVRVISATNFDLYEMAKEGRFRHDLIPRLRAEHIELPPLRERSIEEKEELIKYFASHNPDGQHVKFDPSAMKILQSYDWKQGNIREMRDLIATMLPLASADRTIYADAIPRFILDSIFKKRRLKNEYTNKIATPDNFEITLKFNQKNCRKREIEKIAFSHIFNLFSETLNIKEIGKLFGVSHATVIEIAKRCESEGLIKYSKEKND